MPDTLTAYPSEQEPMGYFRIFAAPLGGSSREITLFRGVPVQISTVGTQDPFTEQTAQLSFPMITVWDNPGEGDLDWLQANTNIDIIWQNVGGYEIDWRWEGYIASYGFSLDGTSSSYTTDLKGAFYGLDDYLAIPTSPDRPIPYEILIAEAFDQDAHPASLGSFQLAFPSWWTGPQFEVPEFTDPAYLRVLKPWGVHTGQRWTGLTSRSTGSWEPLLTGFVQSLLTVAFAEGGSQWSIRNLGSRRPQMFLREIPDTQSDAIIEIDLGSPGVQLNGTRDFTQRAGVIYGQGTDEAGITYSGLELSPDGRTTFFKPFAYSPRMWPRGKNNPNYDRFDKPKEVMIQFQQGVDEISAAQIAQAQYQRFFEPGITGSITLTTDPRKSSGELVPRLLIRGGSTVRINGLFGIREGVLAHITQAAADFTALTTTLTFDTKYRDQLTVAEVQARTRDALTPVRALQVGKFANTINDLVVPWSYKAGSGIIPTEALPFFTEKLPQDAIFPYEDFTTRFPPSNPAYAKWYIKLGPMDPHNSNNNWTAIKRPDSDKQIMAIPIRAAQQGNIRLTQIAAYDKTGHVMPVKFHFSVYMSDGTAVHSMPQFPGARQLASGDPNPDFPKYLPARQVNGTVIPTTYETNGGVAQCHPFYKGAWEHVQDDGTQFPWGKSDPQLPDTGSDFVVGWGNYYEPAGYSPGRYSKGADRTGLLEDATPWSFDLVGPGYVHTDNVKENRKNEYTGMLFIMIYCDDQFHDSVYFMGRLIRQEPGQQ